MPSKSNKLPLLISIVGPTAVGKTVVSIELAHRFDGEIISGDSRTFYNKLNIGTAKPTEIERVRIPHHLIDVSDLVETWSVAKFQKEAMLLIDRIHKKGKLPFLVGGTGQYIKSIVEGWKIPPQSINCNMREILLNWADQINPFELHRRLSVIDPDAALIIDPRNVRRTVRALEVIFLTGKRFSAQRGKSKPPFRNLIIGLNRPRDELYNRIDARLEKMLASGWVTEVKQLLDLGYCQNLPAFSAIGYSEIIKMLDEKISSEEALLMMKKRTRELVRRQANWFKNSDTRINWFIVQDDVVDDISRLIDANINASTNNGKDDGVEK